MSEIDQNEGEARSYHRWQFRLGALGLLLTAGYLVALLVTGAAAHLRDSLAARTLHWWQVVPSAVLILGAGHQLLTLPVSWLGGFWLPRRHGLTPLADGDLRSRLLRLAERARVPAVGVWIADQSRRSRTANAALTGPGRTRRILLFDTLVSRFEPEEVEAVLAHELGHHVAGGVWRGLAVQGAVTLAAFWVADRALAAGAGARGLSGPADPAGLPLLGLVTMAVSLIALPVINGWSRRVETRADDFALRLTRAPGSFIGAMERLADINLAERDPHFLKELVLYSHPSVGRRIARARNRAWSEG
jgi:STE24 endopeptidase